MRRKAGMAWLAGFMAIAIAISGCTEPTGESILRPDAADGADEISIFSFDRRDYRKPDRVLQEIERATGTKLRILTGAWDDTQLDILVTTGDYPDVITIVDSEKSGRFNKWVREGTIIPFDDELLEGLPHLQNVFQHPGYQGLRIDGQFYGLPLKDEFPPNSAGQHVLVMRQDWLDELQLPVPQTLEQFRETLIAFKTLDPDRSGMDDTYGLADAGLHTIVKNLIGAWGIPNDVRSTGFLKVGDHYEYWAIQPEVKEALRFVKELYEDKLILPDTLSMNSNVQVREKFVEGRVGVMFDNMNFEELIKKEEQLRRHMPQARLIELSALQGPDGKRGYSAGAGYWGFTVITDKAKDPKAVARLFDYLLSEEGRRLTLFGVPSIHYTDKDGTLRLHMEERSKEVGFDPNNPAAPHEFSWGLVEWTQMTGDDYLQFRNLTDPSFSQRVADNLARVNQYIVMPAAFDVATPKWISFKSNSDELYREYFNQIVMGDLDLDEGFRKFVEKWNESGGREAMEEMSDAIRASIGNSE